MKIVPYAESAFSEVVALWDACGLSVPYNDPAQDIALVSRDLTELANVEQALARLDDGSYGDCADCGQPIPYARLVAYPAAKRCVACQEKAERLENARK